MTASDTEERCCRCIKTVVKATTIPPCHRDKNFQCHKYLHTSKNQRHSYRRKLVLFDTRHSRQAVSSSQICVICDFCARVLCKLFCRNRREAPLSRPEPQTPQPADVTCRSRSRGPGWEHNSAFCESSWNSVHCRRPCLLWLPGCVWLRL